MKHFKFAALALALSLAACDSNDNSPTDNPPPVPAPQKHVLFFLGDGMGMTTMTAMRIYKVGEDGQLTVDTLPESAFVRTYSEDAQVTDSAPSMAAYMTGVKMKNEVISMSAGTNAYAPDGAQYIDASGNTTCPTTGNGTAAETLLEIMKAAGYGTGVVSTTRITHATPATTYAHLCNRNGENTIAAQMVPGGAEYNAKLGDGIDVVLGGGRRHFLPTGTGSTRSDTRNLIDEMKAKGYAYASTSAELAALPSSSAKVLGLFTGSDMSYELDRDPAVEPSLADMTGKAIDLLAAKNKGFFLMVEGGRIDHALHASNAQRALGDGIAFDDAIALALEKMETIDPGLENTLVVVTADHDHTLVLNGYAQRTGPTTAGHPGVLGVAKSYANGPSQGQPLKDVDGNPYTNIGFGNGPNRLGVRLALDDATTGAKDYLQESTIPLGSETHGGADVFLGATGLGAHNFHGVIDNTEVFGKIKLALGL